MGSVIAEMIRVGVLSLVFSKVTKAIGESEISEIISGTGWVFVGTNAVIVLTPICKSIKASVDGWEKFFNSVGNIAKPFGKLLGY